MAEARLLILGGTAEARLLAARTAAIPGLVTVTSHAGRTRQPRVPAGELRSGGFGGVDGLAEYLAREGVDLAIDATHPFAARISAHAAAACARTATPLVALRRPQWRAGPGDSWIGVDDMEAAAAALDDRFGRVFLAVGGNELACFAGLAGKWFLVRLVEPPSAPPGLADCEVVIGRGPFAVADEKRLMTDRAIDGVVSKNSGGDATYAKIAAARELGLPVVMVRRPPPPEGETVEGVDAAVAWLSERLG